MALTKVDINAGTTNNLSGSRSLPLISTRISGSFTAPSSSFSTRVSNLKSDSGSFSTRVSNLKSDSGSFSTRVSNLKSDSGSISTRLDNSEASGALINQDLKTSASPTFVDITATGQIVAKEIYTEFVSASVVYSSGSNIFGDDGADKHLFTGSLQLSGSLANESYIIGTNVGIGTNVPDKRLHVMQSDASLTPQNTHAAFVFEENDHTTLEIITPNDKEARIQWSDGAAAGAITYNHSAETMRFDVEDNAILTLTDGNVGIGTTAPLSGNSISPSLMLEGTKPAVLIKESGRTDSFLGLWADTGNAQLHFDDGGMFSIMHSDDTIGTNSTTVASFHATGYVGIGEAFTPSEELQIRGTSPLEILINTHTDGFGFEYNSSGATTSTITSWHDSATALMNFVMQGSAGSPITAMSILGDGNVGIGTASPSYTLDVAGNAGINMSSASSEHSSSLNVSGSVEIFQEYGKHPSLYFVVGDNTPPEAAGVDNITTGQIKNTIYNAGADDLYSRLDFYAASQNASQGPIMTVQGNTSGGSVGIGITSPLAQLHIDAASDCVIRLDSGGSGWSGFKLADDGTIDWWMTNDASSGRFQIMDTGEDHGVYIDQNSNSWTSGVSDERLKKDWENFEDATDKLNTLTKMGTYNPVNPSPKSSGKKLVGISANEVQKILPEAVDTQDDGYLSLRYQDVFVLMLKSIQELSAKVEEQAKRIEELEG